MDSMSHDPAAGDIGSQLVDIGSQGISAGSTAAVSVLSGLVPAGGEEVSMQAVMAFAQEAATMLASNAAAQEELMRAGTALTDIARMYGESDESAAGALAFSSSAMSRFGSAAGSSGGGGLSAAALQSELGAAARSPVVAGLAQAPSSSLTSTAVNAGSSAMSGAAPLGSGMSGAGTSGGASKAGLASATSPADDQDERKPESQDDEQAGERLL
ncbi:PE family protein [Mycobacterium sp. ML4]